MGAMAGYIAAATFVISLTALVHRAATAEYIVGESEGWTFGPSYLAWSQKYNFSAGDALIFNYVKGQHNVYEVTEDAFRTCDARNATFHVWDAGSDVVNLTTPAKYYFLCNIQGHCLGGMRLAVTVSAPLPPPPSPPPPPATMPPPPPRPQSSGASRRMVAWPEQLWVSSLALAGLWRLV